MKVRSLLVAVVVSLFLFGTAGAQMDRSGMMGTDNSVMANGTGSHMQGRGHGMGGAGKMMSSLSAGMKNHWYLDTLTPITTPGQAVACRA